MELLLMAESVLELAAAEAVMIMRRTLGLLVAQEMPALCISSGTSRYDSAKLDTAFEDCDKIFIYFVCTIVFFIK